MNPENPLRGTTSARFVCTLSLLLLAGCGGGEGGGSVEVTPPAIPALGGGVAPIPDVFCTTYAATNIADVAFPANGTASLVHKTSDAIYSQGGPGWHPYDVVLLRFTAPETGDQHLKISLESDNPLIKRTFALSSKPCEFTATANTFFAVERYDMEFSMQSGSVGTQLIKLTPGQTYYLNMRNYAESQFTCLVDQCNLTFSLINPLP